MVVSPLIALMHDQVEGLARRGIPATFFASTLDSNAMRERMRELRRGADKAEIYGVAFRPDEREVCVWSDKGTVHVFALTAGSGAS